MSQITIGQWLDRYPLMMHEVDCAITVMLKILDGKCKMKPLDKKVMAALYDEVYSQPSYLFGDDIHHLIKIARSNAADEALKDQIYEKRVLAETKISRPVMKAFKATIRQNGLFECLDYDDD